MGGLDQTDSGAAYVFLRTRTTWNQQAYLKASNTGAGDEFGGSVAVFGDTVVVGACREDSDATDLNGDGNNNLAADSGAAYVFVRSGTTWSVPVYLKASNTGVGDGFGGSVAVSGDTVVVTAAGEDSSARGVNGNQANDLFADSGAAYVFVDAGTFTTFGVGCPGTAGVPALAAAAGDLPRIGELFEMELSGLPVGNAVAGCLGLSNTQWGLLALPLDASLFGAFGCTVYVSLDVSGMLVNNGGTATWGIFIPGNPGLIGLHFYVQGLVQDLGANPLNIIATNAGEAVIGGQE